MTQLVSRILETYKLDWQKIEPVQSGYRNKIYPIQLKNKQTINLIIYKAEPAILAKIKLANQLGDQLAQQGLPARRPLTTKIIKIHQPGLATYACLYNYLPGSTIAWEAYTMNHIKLLGLAMANMHCTLEKSTVKAPLVTSDCQQLLSQMELYFQQAGVIAALQQKLQLEPPKLDSYSRLLQQANQQPSQLLHMDFVRGNILFDSIPEPVNHQPLDSHHSVSSSSTSLSRSLHPALDARSRLKEELLLFTGSIKPGMTSLEKSSANPFESNGLKQPTNLAMNATNLALGNIQLTGILDLEKASYGPVVFDIARSLAFLLVDCKYKTEPQIRKYFLQSGYIKRGGGKLDKTSLALLEPLLNLFLLHDFYKFLRHNPYEYLPQNEHYQRTVELLKQRGVLQ